MPARICKTHLSAIPANNQEVLQIARSVQTVLRAGGAPGELQLRGRQGQVARLLVQLAGGSAECESEVQVADWFS